MSRGRGGTGQVTCAERAAVGKVAQRSRDGVVKMGAGEQGRRVSAWGI